MQPDENQTNDLPRRGFIRNAWTWILGAAVLVLSYPVFSFIRFQTPPERRQIRVAKTVLPGVAHTEKDFVLFLEPGGETWAVSRKCTHLGCQLNFNAVEGLFICPCHQSKFTRQGQRVAGPAQRDLQRFSVTPLAESEGGGYIITL